jgi:hypothetical protein
MFTVGKIGRIEFKNGNNNINLRDVIEIQLTNHGGLDIDHSCRDKKKWTVTKYVF